MIRRDDLIGTHASLVACVHIRFPLRMRTVRPLDKQDLTHIHSLCDIVLVEGMDHQRVGQPTAYAVWHHDFVSRDIGVARCPHTAACGRGVATTLRARRLFRVRETPNRLEVDTLPHPLPPNTARMWRVLATKAHARVLLPTPCNRCCDGF